MSRSVEYRLAALEALVANLVRVGTISQVNYSGPVPKARVQIGQLETTWLPLPAVRAGGDRATWLLEVGEQVVVLAPGGRLEEAMISHSLHKTTSAGTTVSADVAKIQFSDGSIVKMNRSTGVLTLEPVTKLEINADVEITGNVTHNGNYTQTGNYSLTGDVTQTGNYALTGSMTVSVDITVNGISFVNHQHPNGTGGAPTGLPY